jgi:hypothetical protein
MTDAETVTTAESKPRVDVYLREQVPPPVAKTVDDTVERLHELERDGVVSEVSVDSWGHRSVRGVDESGSIETTIREFERWADRTGHSLRPAFDRREVSSMFCEGSVLRHDVPIISLAVYEDGQLQCVTPCTDDDCTYTVRDCLDVLAESDEAVQGTDAPLTITHS